MTGKIKKYSWAIGLGGVAVTSFVSAYATNRFIAQKLAAPETVQGLPPPGAGAARQATAGSSPPSPEGGAPGVAPVAPGGEAAPPGGGASNPEEGTVASSGDGSVQDASWHDTYRIILTRNIFDSETALDWPEVVSPEGGDAQQGPYHGPLSIRLSGTVAASPAQFSWALISKGEANATVETFRIGDDLYGEGTLKEVRRNEIVVLRADGTEEVVGLFTGEVASNAPPPPPKASDSNEIGNSVRKVAENKYEIDQRDIKNAMDNVEKLAEAARIVPSFENGNPVGFKVFRIKPDSFYNKLGIRNGDVISKINGFEINSTEKALQMYQILRTEKNISLDVTRRGQKMTMEYSIR